MSVSPENLKQIEEAKASLAKLPILGPVMWLYARDERRKWTFIADHDWLLMPPIVLDQCRLYTKSEIPWAFFTWAFVNDEVHQRLNNGVAKIAPHEWRGGTHCWLLDGIAPFGGLEECLTDLRGTSLAGQAINRFAPQPDGRIVVEQLPAVAPIKLQ
jgi:cytolysin-activating lysine-acyltransferase